ncbi:MAG: DNA alkylation repair protein [Asgard group archaeon]|nr:DNA alkylation repair protein [Asgard group archaeon]
MSGKKSLSYEEIIQMLEENADPNSLEGMARAGITPEHAYGVKIPILRKIAKKAGRNSELAKKLWTKNTRETRILACMIENPKTITEAQAEKWVKKFDYWEICDQCIMNLFDRTEFTVKKIFEWTKRDEEYVKRAGFALIARVAWSDKTKSDEEILEFLPLIIREAKDERNMVKKAVNWALRQIGKRNLALNKEAVKVAKVLTDMESKSAKWIASDALKELTSESIQKRLKRNE